MPSFWSYITNGKYSIGCTGQTVYVYDENGVELAKFKDLIYAYDAAISPNGEIFVVKSVTGKLAVYSLAELRLLKKFRFSKIDSQSGNFCFSPDGKRFYNIERHNTSLQTALSIYRTDDFSLEKRWFSEDPKMFLCNIEYDEEAKEYFILGYFRDNDGIADSFFVAKLGENTLADAKFISENECNYYRDFKDLEFRGFTKKAKDWTLIGYDVEGIENRKHTLAKLWNHYHTTRNH